MRPTDRHPQFLAAAIAATGALYLAPLFLDLPFPAPQPPGAYFLMGLSAVYVAAGACFFVRARQGALEPQEKTVTDVRLQAVAKMESRELLSRIALEDPEAAVRRQAARRLEEIAV
jgi:hypothetical protein